jgi:signal peptidase II
MKRFYFVALLILIVDHVTKWMARATLESHQPIELISGYLRLSYVHNSGVAFGLFDKVDSPWKPYILAAMAVLAVILILLYRAHMPADRTLLQLALAVTMGGILGNFLDRVIRGYVVDFIEFHIHEVFYWPTFNVADSAITIGIALLLIDTVKNPSMEKVAEH